jgi:hypothetical protein
MRRPGINSIVVHGNLGALKSLAFIVKELQNGQGLVNWWYPEANRFDFLGIKYGILDRDHYYEDPW